MVESTTRQKGFFPDLFGIFFKRCDTSEPGTAPKFDEELHHTLKIFHILIVHAPVYFCACAPEAILFIVRKFNAVLWMWYLFGH